MILEVMHKYHTMVAGKLIVFLTVATVAAMVVSADEVTTATVPSNVTKDVCFSMCYTDDTQLEWCGQTFFDCPVNQTCTTYSIVLDTRYCSYQYCEDPLPICELDAACRNNTALLCDCRAGANCDTQDPEDDNPFWKCVVPTTTDTVATAMP